MSTHTSLATRKCKATSFFRLLTVTLSMAAASTADLLGKTCASTAYFALTLALDLHQKSIWRTTLPEACLNTSSHPRRRSPDFQNLLISLSQLGLATSAPALAV